MNLFQVFVFDTSASSAKAKAFNFITDFGWSVVKVEDEAQPTPELIASWDEPPKSYRNAELNGIGAVFHAWPKEARPGVYSYETLKKPPNE